VLSFSSLTVRYAYRIKKCYQSENKKDVLGYCKDDREMRPNL